MMRGTFEGRNIRITNCGRNFRWEIGSKKENGDLYQREIGSKKENNNYYQGEFYSKTNYWQKYQGEIGSKKGNGDYYQGKFMKKGARKECDTPKRY